MKINEIKLIKDLYKHYDKNQTVDEDFLDSLSKDYGSIRGILMNVILKFDPNSNVSDDYIDSKLIEYKIEVDSQNNEQLTKEKEKVNDSNTPSDSNDNKTTSPNTSKKYLWLILIPTILILLFGIGYGIGFYGEDDEYSLDEADDALTPTLVESKDSNKMFNAVPDEYIDYSNKYIKLKRAYFYSYPNKESRLRSYVVMGDNIQYDPQSLVNGFYNSKFINANNGVTTSGWIHQDAIFPDQKTLIDGSSLTEKLPKKELVANIVGNDIIIRETASSSSKIIGSFQRSGEEVNILDEYDEVNSLQAILNRDLSIKINDELMSIEKGRSLTIISDNEGKYLLSFKDKDLEEHKIKLEHDYVNVLPNKWFKVKRKTGEVGWVFYKYIEKKTEKGFIDMESLISEYLQSEDNRNFNEILGYYDMDNVSRYWNLNYPSIADMRNAYNKAWSITTNSKNKIKSINKLNNSTFDTYIEYTFYHIKDKEWKMSNTVVRFVFGQNNKIVEVYGKSID